MSIQRYFAAINTTYAPEWFIANLARDFQTGLININSETADSLARKMFANFKPAIQSAYRNEMGKQIKGDKMDEYYKEFRQAGGRMTFFGLRDFENLQNMIQKEIKKSNRTGPASAIKYVMGRIESFNSALENTTRLAGYAALRDAGYSVQQSAYVARNLTVNFTKKGTAGTLLNAAYLFSNAGIQGTARLVRALTAKGRGGRIVRRTVGAIVLAGMFMDFLNRYLGGDDETGRPYYDKIPLYTKMFNLIIMIPNSGGKFVRFHLPYGYAFFAFFGQTTASVFPKELGGAGKKPSTASVDLVVAALNNFNPLGGSGSLLSIILPQLAKPVGDLATNRDYAGRMISPEPSPYDATPPPDSQRYWGNVNPTFRWVAEKLNELTGGSEIRSGKIDVSPETLEYVYQYLTGSVGTFVAKVSTTPYKVLKGISDQDGLNDLINQIPFTSKVTGAIPSWVDSVAYNEARKEVLLVKDELKLAREARDTARIAEIRRESPEMVRLIPFMTSMDQKLKELRTQKRKLYERYDASQEGYGPLRYGGDEGILERIEKNNELQRKIKIEALKRYQSAIDQ